MAPPLVCVAFWDGERGEVLGREDGLRWVREALSDSGTALVAHHSPYDLAVVMAADPTLIPVVFQAVSEGRCEDTRVRDALLDIALGAYRRPSLKLTHQTVSAYSLAGCVSRHLDRDISEGKTADSWRLRYGELRDIEPERWPSAAYDYALGDAKDVFDLYHAQTKVARVVTLLFNGKISGTQVTRDKRVARNLSGASHRFGHPIEDVLIDAPAQCRAGLALHLMSVWGLRTDAEAVEALAASLQGELDALEPDLVAAGVRRPDGTTDLKALRERVGRAYAINGKKLPTTEKTGAPATDKTTCKRSGDPLLVAYGEASETRKLLTTYVPVLREGVTRPIHPYYNVLVNSGRTSSDHPNIQNPPRKGGVRECFVPRPGYVFVACDYDSSELRALAQVCWDVLGRSKLADAYRADASFDPHTLFASSMLDLTYEEGLRLKDRSARFNVQTGSGGQRRLECGHPPPREANGESVFPCEDCFSRFKARRQQSKCANFGYAGGMGARSFVSYAGGQGVKLTLAESEALRDQWFSQWPEMESYFKYINDLLRPVGEGPILQLRSLRVRGGCTYTSASNTLFQGLSSEGAKRAAWVTAHEAYAKPESPLYGCRPVIFLHDEIVIEAPQDRAAAAATRLSEVMVVAMEVFTPDVPATASATMMRRWYKGAEPVYDADGALAVWEPVDASL